MLPLIDCSGNNRESWLPHLLLQLVQIDGRCLGFVSTGAKSHSHPPRHGVEKAPDKETGIIQNKILEALSDVERGSLQTIIDIWCEAKLQNGQYVRCWPQYRSNQGSRYDWVMVKFDSTEGKEHVKYPSKVLALYEDIDGAFKALVHSTAYKTDSAIEGPYGDTRLVKHYRLEFDGSSRDPKLYSIPFEDILHCVLLYEAVLYREPLAPKVRSPRQQREHTVMIIRPRREWARLFLEWSRDLKRRQSTVTGINKNRLDWK